MGETRSIAHNSHLLKEMLDDTRREVEALRDELEHTRQQVTTDALTGLKTGAPSTRLFNRLSITPPNLTHR